MSASPDTNRRGGQSGTVLLAGLALLCLTVVADLCSGASFGFDGMVTALTQPDSLQAQILLHVRGPRAVTAVVAGMGLGVAGHTLQSVLGNQLAAPELVGVGPGAVVGILIGTGSGALTAGQSAGSLVAAWAGGMAAGVLTFVIASRVSRFSPIVIGVAVTALASGITVLAVAARSAAYGEALRWLVGSVAGQTWPAIGVGSLWTLLWVAVLVAAGPVVTLLSTGDEFAYSAGVRVPAVRTVVLLVVVCVVAGAVALAGAIGFVGLIAGHAARRVMHTVGPAAIVAAGLLGAAMLCGSDALAQLLTAVLTTTQKRAGIPAGAVTAVLGAVVLVQLVRRREVTR